MTKTINIANGHHVRSQAPVGYDKYKITYYDSNQIDYLTQKQVEIMLKEVKS